MIPATALSAARPAPASERPLSTRPLIYVASYYSAHPAHGTAHALSAWRPLLDAGWLPLVPHLSWLADVAHPAPETFWYAYDLALLSRCDALYVCPGALTESSRGVTDEIAHAERLGLPVLRSVVPPEDAL